MVISAALIARYQALKAEVPDALLMMQVGAFLQVMNADARAVAALTGLKLPKRRADDRRAIRHCACATTAAGRQAGPERDPASSRTADGGTSWRSSALRAGSDPVAWFRETGRRLGGIAERTLSLYWGTPQPGGTRAALPPLLLSTAA